MQLGESLEDYLESIYMLSKLIDPIRSVDVASHLGFSKPSVSHAIKILSEQGYVELDSNKYIHLTDEGLQIAEETYRRHEFFTEMLQEIGVPKSVAQQDACRIEHVLSQESFDAIRNYYLNHKEKSL